MDGARGFTSGRGGPVTPLASNVLFDKKQGFVGRLYTLLFSIRLSGRGSRLTFHAPVGLVAAFGRQDGVARRGFVTKSVGKFYTFAGSTLPPGRRILLHR
jgi:hypothetical protein